MPDAAIQAYPRGTDYYVNVRILTLIMCGSVYLIKMHHASSRQGAERRDLPRNVTLARQRINELTHAMITLLNIYISNGFQDGVRENQYMLELLLMNYVLKIVV